MTARWVVDIADDRDLSINWKPISLLVKNQTTPDSPFFDAVTRSHGLLRVMESVRAAEGDAALQALYFEYGARIHHDKALEFDPVDALVSAGLDPVHAAAFTDASFDAVIKESMDDGLGLTGNDVGTPIIAKLNAAGQRVAYFGPVITRVPAREQALKLWDCLDGLMDIEGFWELKRTRTESPDFGDRPEQVSR